MELEIMAFVISVPIPIPMPRFQCRGLQMAINKDKWIDYIINLESKLKDCFNYFKMRSNFQKENLMVFSQLAVLLEYCTVISKYAKQSLTVLPNFDLFFLL